MELGTLAIVIIAILFGYFLGKRASRPHERPSIPIIPEYDAAVHAAAALSQFDGILSQDRDLTQKELGAYTDLIALNNAAAIAARQGRKVFTPADALEGIKMREAKVAEATSIFDELRRAGDLWEQEERETGRRDGPAGIRARQLLNRYETLLSEAGEINALRKFRGALVANAGATEQSGESQ